jgi:hypothetical protein
MWARLSGYSNSICRGCQGVVHPHFCPDGPSTAQLLAQALARAALRWASNRPPITTAAPAATAHWGASAPSQPQVAKPAALLAKPISKGTISGSAQHAAQAPTMPNKPKIDFFIVLPSSVHGHIPVY